MTVLIALAAAAVAVANARIQRRGTMRMAAVTAPRALETVRAILASPYLRLITAVVCLTAIVTESLTPCLRLWPWESL